MDKKEKDFKPHMMYDPKTGKGYMAKKYADHVKMDKMGYTHDKPEMNEKAPKIDDKKFAAHMNKNKKPKTMNSTQKSLAHIRQRADSIVKSKKSTASMRNSAGLRRLRDAKVEEGVIKKVANKLAKKVQKKTRDPNVVRRLAHRAATAAVNATEQDMSGMCCKNCGDMYGKPTKENKSCMYNAYDAKGKNWINAEKYHGEAVITPKMQKRALASPAAKAKPKSQVTLPKMPKLSIDKDKDKNKTNEAFDFKVNIDGFPEMFMSGNSPSEVKTHLRKLVKQPSMIQSVDRVTKADKKKHHRDKVRESLDEASKTVQSMMKIVDKKQAMKIDGVMVDMFTASAVTQIYNKVNDANKAKMDKMKATQLANVAMKLLKKESLGEGVNEDPCWDTHKQVGMKKKGNKMVPNCVPKNEDNVDELSLSRRDITKSGIGKTGVDKDKVKKDLEKLKLNLKKRNERQPLKAGGMKRMSTGDGMDTFKKKPPEKTNEEVNEKVEYVEYKFKNERDAKAAKKYFDGIQLMSFDVNDDNVRGGKLMVDSGSKDMTKYHKEVMKKFRPKVMTQESYAPDEGTPAARKKASKMTPGQEGVMDFLKNVGNTVMYGTQKSKPTQSQPRSRINTNRNSTSGNANSIASRINFGGKYGNK